MKGDRRMELVFKLGTLVGLMNSFLLFTVTLESFYFTRFLDLREFFLTSSERSHFHNKLVTEAPNSRAIVNGACVTTLNRDAIPPTELGFMLFSAPPKFTSSSLPESMKTWRDALKGKGTYVVITNDPQTRRVCKENHIATLCVEHSDEDLPLLDKMYERMGKSQPEGIIAYVNSDIYPEDVSQLYDFLSSLQNTALEVHQPIDVDKPYLPTGKSSDFWFAVASRTNVDAQGTRSRHIFGGYDFWAWNTKSDGIPLLPFDMPPFRFPFANYDNWLLDSLVQASQRNVIDMSHVIDITHHEHVRVGKAKSWYEALMNGVSGVYINRHFAYHEPRTTLLANGLGTGPYSKIRHLHQFGTPLDCPYYAKKRNDGTFYLVRRDYWTNLSQENLESIRCTNPSHRCERSRSILSNTTEQERNVAVIPFSGVRTRGSKMEIAAGENWRYTIDNQLKQHATEGGFVLLTAVNYAYRELLMNFKCTLERVGMRDHFVIAALDKQVYEWGVLRGLPIYLASSAGKEESDLVVQGSDYGGDGFKSVTKLKSVAVLEVLKKGFGVIWSDVDITWFRHPFDALADYMRKDGGIAIQSNAPYVENSKKSATPHETVVEVAHVECPAAVRRLNSGLYVAPSNPLVIQAFRDIVRHARKSRWSEQPSFDEVLCARNPSERHCERCTYRPALKGNMVLSQTDSPSLHVELLDRFKFPNGAVLIGEDNDNVYNLGLERFAKATGQELIAAHNNWISGEIEKKARQVAAGWWFGQDLHGCKYHGDEALL
jgi:Nucleotide-diphospho-sugar transferase